MAHHSSTDIQLTGGSQGSVTELPTSDDSSVAKRLIGDGGIPQVTAHGSITDDSAAAKSLTGGRGIPQVAAQGSVTELPGANDSATGDTKRVITPDTQDSDIKFPRILIMMKSGA
ncbi:hypothetical protein TIFTF001_014534 [Ficus carica]|uniref:Uncharacterized protein n=1 Tax=Ficus carica TaxID=3494 RepID=A0AA88ARC9_FICCA|nr:hypothetical protein TIFTF001_014534 [Ficus carica]